MLTNGQREVYASHVWDAVVQRRCSVAPEMSSAEWHVLATWMDKGIPLRIVLRGIKDCTGTPRTLLCFRAAVEEAAHKWRRALA